MYQNPYPLPKNMRVCSFTRSTFSWDVDTVPATAPDYKVLVYYTGSEPIAGDYPSCIAKAASYIDKLDGKRCGFYYGKH